MAKVYRIGRFEFNTYLEYVRALEDVKKIDKITHSVDIYDPDTAFRIYRAIEDGNLTFDSKIGKRFYIDLVKIVAKNKEETQKKARNRKAPERAGRVSGSSKKFPRIQSRKRRSRKRKQ